jgi:hypothetical protein
MEAHEAQREAFNLFAGFGVVGVIAFLAVLFLVLLFALLLRFAKKIIDKYLPDLIAAAIAALLAMKDSQQTIARNQETLVEQSGTIIETQKRLVTLAESDSQKTDKLIGALATQVPHVTSCSRMEIAFLEFCDVCDVFADALVKEDLALQQTLKTHTGNMRSALLSRIHHEALYGSDPTERQ